MQFIGPRRFFPTHFENRWLDFLFRKWLIKDLVHFVAHFRLDIIMDRTEILMIRIRRTEKILNIIHCNDCHTLWPMIRMVEIELNSSRGKRSLQLDNILRYKRKLKEQQPWVNANARQQLSISYFPSPKKEKRALWELDSDYYLHVSGIGDDLMPGSSFDDAKPSVVAGIPLTPVQAFHEDFSCMK
ncbi:phosphoinositide phosphatase sac1 [Phtheirospermum japonicum]|uniref:Phosphoinositide phosphatase sac1 n=1 Tax=Phtheirospermum japonicum TaxID=374723 RepID=A0A830BAG3_9LAMI|nr:phosphoinositide phosphatase sac1 [Phtheirospermum japonicum]